MLDVLEHVDDPVAVLRDLHSLAVPGASLIVTVPAFRFLWSEWDRVLGHKTRYTIRQLRADLLAAGWRTSSVRYIFNFMFFPAFFRSLLLRRSIARSEFPRVPPLLNEILIAWHDFESHVPGIPFGTSILGTALRVDTGRPLGAAQPGPS